MPWDKIRKKIANYILPAKPILLGKNGLHLSELEADFWTKEQILSSLEDRVYSAFYNLDDSKKAREAVHLAHIIAKKANEKSEQPQLLNDQETKDNSKQPQLNNQEANASNLNQTNQKIPIDWISPQHCEEITFNLKLAAKVIYYGKTRKFTELQTISKKFVEPILTILNQYDISSKSVENVATEVKNKIYNGLIKEILYENKTRFIPFNNNQTRAAYHTNPKSYYKQDNPNLVIFSGNVMPTKSQAQIRSNNIIPDEFSDGKLNFYNIIYRRKLLNEVELPKKETSQKESILPEAILAENIEKGSANTDIQNDVKIEQKANHESAKIVTGIYDDHVKSMQELLDDCYYTTEQIITNTGPNAKFTFYLQSLGVSLGINTILKLIKDGIINKDNLPKLIIVCGMKNPAIVAASQFANYATAPLITIFSVPLVYFSITTFNPIFLACVGLLALMIGYIVVKKLIYDSKTIKDVKKYYTDKNPTKSKLQQYSKFRGDKISTLFAKCLEPIFRYVIKRVGWYIDTQSDFNELTQIYKAKDDINKITFMEAFRDQVFVAGSQLEFKIDELKFDNRPKKCGMQDDEACDYDCTKNNYYVLDGHNDLPKDLQEDIYSKMNYVEPKTCKDAQPQQSESNSAQQLETPIKKIVQQEIILDNKNQQINNEQEKNILLNESNEIKKFIEHNELH